MDYLAAPGVTGSLQVTVLGAVVVCLVLLVLYHVLVAKKAFVAVPVPAGLQTAGWALNHLQQDQTNVGGTAGFHAGPEPPVYWGSSGGEELDIYQHGGASAETMGLDAQAGFSSKKNVHTDAELLMRSKGH